MEWEIEGYLISTDPDLMNLDTICRLLGESYWASTRCRQTIELSIRHSIVFGLYQDNTQIGFARLVTDYATFAWLCDVIVDSGHRSGGLGKWLVECVLSHPDIASLRILLRTRDAEGLYERFGFRKIDDCMWRDDSSDDRTIAAGSLNPSPGAPGEATGTGK